MKNKFFKKCQTFNKELTIYFILNYLFPIIDRFIQLIIDLSSILLIFFLFLLKAYHELPLTLLYPLRSLFIELSSLQLLFICFFIYRTLPPYFFFLFYNPLIFLSSSLLSQGYTFNQLKVFGS